MAEYHADEERDDAGPESARRPHRSLLMLDRSRHDAQKREGILDRDHPPGDQASVERANKRTSSSPDDEVVDKMEFLGNWLQRAHAYTACADELARPSCSSFSSASKKRSTKLRLDLRRKGHACRILCIPPTILELPSSCESWESRDCE
jgi:hypothetical protein